MHADFLSRLGAETRKCRGGSRCMSFYWPGTIAMWAVILVVVVAIVFSVRALMRRKSR